MPRDSPMRRSNTPRVEVGEHDDRRCWGPRRRLRPQGRRLRARRGCKLPMTARGIRATCRPESRAPRSRTWSRSPGGCVRRSGTMTRWALEIPARAVIPRIIATPANSPWRRPSAQGHTLHAGDFLSTFLQLVTGTPATPCPWDSGPGDGAPGTPAAIAYWFTGLGRGTSSCTTRRVEVRVDGEVQAATGG